MLTPNLDQKAVPHGSRLLAGLIVRSNRGLVEGIPLLLQCSQKSRSSIADLRSGDPRPRCPRPVAPLQKREGFWRFAQAHLREYFPTLPSQSQFNRRMRALEGEMSALQEHLARQLSGRSEIYHILDTTLIPAVVRVRACRKGQFAGEATFGRCLSKTEWIYGFKVGLTITPEGVITAFCLAEAAADERPIGDVLICRDGHGAYLADKGFSSVDWERRWLAEYGALVAATPKDNSRRAWSEANRR